MGIEMVRPAPIAMHSHSHVLNGACCCFSEAGSVCQRDRGTRLAVAGVLSGTALECRVPGVGLSPRWGWRSGIAPRLLLNAVVVVDGKSLMGEREIVCCRVISHSGTRWSDACVFASQMCCFGSLFHAIRWCSSGRGSDAVTSRTGGGHGYASLWMTQANPSVSCGLGLQGGRK
ncbi:trans-sialidase [Trypanosoma cruzi]|nr:trans-sialidase [Trypanosoma cruzi]